MSDKKDGGEKKGHKHKFDQLDLEILARLQEDARRSYREIAHELGISVGTVHNRITKLMNSQILMGFQPILNSKTLGYDLCFLILITIQGGHAHDVLDDIQTNPSVRAIYHTTGDHDAALICRFQKLEDAREFISEVSQKQYIDKAIANLVLDVVKEDLNVDVHTLE